MKKKEVAALVERLSPHLPEVRIKIPMVVFPPYREILRALYFDRSEDAEYFYLWVFFMPLCVPAEHVAFNLGRRVRGDIERWHSKDPELLEKLVSRINDDALPFLENAQTPLEAARFVLFTPGAEKSPYVHQANAYLLARAGKIFEASQSLDDLLHLLEPDVTWQAEIAARAEKLRALLLNSPEDAQAQLRAWEIESIHNLGLEGVGFTATGR
jgi:hypothetical protein